jgi:hypothetical protein
MVNNVDQEAPKYQIQGQWLSNQIKFVLPPWQTEQAKTRTGYSTISLYEPYNHTAQPLQHVPVAALPPQQGPAGGSGPGTHKPATPPPRPTTAPPQNEPPRTPGSESSSLSEYITPPTRNLGTPRHPSVQSALDGPHAVHEEPQPLLTESITRRARSETIF